MKRSGGGDIGLGALAAGAAFRTSTSFSFWCVGACPLYRTEIVRGIASEVTPSLEVMGSASADSLGSSVIFSGSTTKSPRSELKSVTSTSTG